MMKATVDEPTRLSVRFVDRNNTNAPPEMVAHAEDWVRLYLQGEPSFVCFVCERPFALPEPVPRYHVVIGRWDGQGNVMTGGVCDDCCKHGDDHCMAGVEKHCGLEFRDIIRPHQIHKPGRA